MLTLVPQALAVTIPMALLVGLLVGLGPPLERPRMGRPAGLRRQHRPGPPAGAGPRRHRHRPGDPLRHTSGRCPTPTRPPARSATASSPSAPRARSSRGCSSSDFPNRVLFVRDVPPGRRAAGGTCSWPTRRTRTTRSSTWRTRGRMVLDRAQRTVELVLEDGTQHTSQADAPQDYSVARFQQLVLSLDPRPCSRASGPAEGRPRDDDRRAPGADRQTSSDRASPRTTPVMEIQKKFSIPAACLVFALLGAALRPDEPARRQVRRASSRASASSSSTTCSS